MTSLVLPGVVGERYETDDLNLDWRGTKANRKGKKQSPYYPKSKIREFAEFHQRHPTNAERDLGRILEDYIPNRYVVQHVVSGTWIADFFIPEIRLAIEVDGGYHSTGTQQQKDRLKRLQAETIDVTILRVSNQEVCGDRASLLVKLRAGWIEAKNRHNRIIGKPFDPSP